MDEVWTDHWDSDNIHYRISAFGKHYHLNLTLESGFIAPLYTVTVLGAPQGANRTDAEGEEQEIGEGEEEEEEDTELRHCFYRGHVNAQEQHAAVISLCSGLVSFYARSELRAQNRFTSGCFTFSTAGVHEPSPLLKLNKAALTVMESFPLILARALFLSQTTYSDNLIYIGFVGLRH